MMTVMQAMMDASAEHDRLEVEIGDAGRDIQAGLALHAQRLQGIGILRTANQEVAATADTDGGVGADTAIAAREFAVPEPAVRRIHRPAEMGLRGDAEIEADAPDGRHISLGPAAFALKHALQARHRTDDETDILTAMAFEDSRLHRRRQRICGCKRANERGAGNGEGRKAHWSLISAGRGGKRDATGRKRHVQNKALAPIGVKTSDFVGRCGTSTSGYHCLRPALPQITAEALDTLAGVLQIGGFGSVRDAERRPEPE